MPFTLSFLFFVCCVVCTQLCSSLRIPLSPSGRMWIATLSISASMTLLPSVTVAAIDCNKDCVKSCVKVAPGSTDYCVESCRSYCNQDDRQDGLSGSVDASRGETGLFGGSIDGTVTQGDDKPPTLLKLIPDSMLNVGKVRMN